MNKTIEIVYLDSKGDTRSDYFKLDKNYTVSKDNAQFVEAVKTSLNDVKEIVDIRENLEPGKIYKVRFSLDNTTLKEIDDVKGEDDRALGEALNEVVKDLNADDLDNLKIEVLSETKNIAESYVEDKPGEYTIWSASDLVSSEEQIPLVKILPNTAEGTVSVDYDVYSYIDTDEIDPKTGRLKEPTEVVKKKTIDIPNNAPIIAKRVGDSRFDVESEKIANDVIRTAYSGGKNPNVKDVLIRLDKTLNHNDPFFSVEFDRSITNPGSDILASQTLRTIRDDLKAAANNKSATEDTIVDKYLELTGVDYYEDLVFDEDQYDTILKLQGRAVDKDRRKYYEAPAENEYMKRLKDLAEDLIEKVNLKNDPDFYKR